jgi:hypothetical protein
LTALLAEVALFFENGKDLFNTARNSVDLFLLRVTFLTQGAFKKFVQSHFDRTDIVTRIVFQEPVTDQRVNFHFA